MSCPSARLVLPCLAPASLLRIRKPRVAVLFLRNGYIPLFDRQQQRREQDAAQEPQQMERKYKALRPAIPSPTTSESGQASRSQSSAPFRRKRVQVKIACDLCRSKKSACDGQRPLCSACLRRGSACTFGGRPADTPDSSTSLTPNESERNSEAADFLGLLASVPPEEALDMLIELRSHSDVPTALKHAKFSRDLQEYDQPSFFPPPDQESTEFELMTRHPILYPVSVPLDFPQATTRSRPQHQTEQAAELEPYGVQSEASLSPYWLSGYKDSTESPIGDIPMSLDPSVGQEFDIPQLRALYDHRLESVNFSNWTSASVSDLEAARAISEYLRLDHPILGFFNADLFLDDLSSNGSRFCSSLLVNALLSWAYVDPKPVSTHSGPVNDFYPLALGLLAMDDGIDSLTKLAALQLLSLTATYQGYGSMAMKLIRQAVDMGRRMQLLTDGPIPMITTPISTDPSVKAACYAAWGLFSYVTLHSMHCQRCEFGMLSPPHLPTPTSLAADSRSKTPEASVHNYTELIFEHLCRLCAITHDMVVRYYSPNRRQLEATNTDFVGVMFKRFFDWGHNLPLSLARGNRTTHHGLVLHIYFHAAVISLLRPLVTQQQFGMNLGLSALDGNPAESISAASVNQLKRLIVSYQSRRPSELATVHWHTACLYVANAVIRGHGDHNSRRPYFYRCLEGYKMLYPKYAVVGPIFKGLLSMAVYNGIITSQEAYEALGQLLAKKQDRSVTVQPTESCFMVDLDLALTDLTSAHVDSLAQRFDDMVMFDNFTHGRTDGDGGVSLSLP